MFKDIITSQVSSEFVSPLFPKQGDDVELKIFTGDVKVKNVAVFTNRFGLEWRYDMSQEGSYYKCKVKAPYKPEGLRYYFSFDYEDRIYYLSKKGFTMWAPCAKDQFFIVTDYTSPKYIASSTCYQIFPDRFCNGDKSNDVKDGEYVFNGGVVSAHTFDEIPDEYEKARCVDFFNGDLKGIEEKLSYLNDLGITVLYINPILRSRTVHRFDCIDYFNVDEKLGGNEALISLTKKAHELGIKIVIDISINHTGSDHEWFKKAQEDPECEEASYYYKKEDGSFLYWQDVDTLPQLNYNNQKLRDIVYRSADAAMKKFLLPPYSIDGWRLDVAPELGRTETDQLCKEVWREVKTSLRGVKDDLYLVGEDWNDATEYLEGDMWDATMNYFGSGRLLRSWMGEKDRFQCGGWGHSPELEKYPMDAYTLAEALKDTENASQDLSRFFRMNLFDSHDTPRLHNNSAIYDEDIYKGVVMALYMLPGMPNIYYGDEISIGGKLGSVEASRYPMVWDESMWNKGMLNTHKIMGALRKNNDDLAFASAYYIPLNKNTLAIFRKGKEKGYLLLLNKNEEVQNIVLDNQIFKGYQEMKDIENGENQKLDSPLSLPSNKSRVFILQ
ncbi:MAG: glycoside hydrolase family 13 protein [Spirochaetales bacterium]|nr:glycoside hydrolase family 13 protein [Spirochaetales bacterium]